MLKQAAVFFLRPRMRISKKTKYNNCQLDVAASTRLQGGSGVESAECSFEMSSSGKVHWLWLASRIFLENRFARCMHWIRASLENCVTRTHSDEAGRNFGFYGFELVKTFTQTFYKHSCQPV